MKIYPVVFYLVSVLIAQRSASAKSFIFNKFNSGPGLDHQKGDDLGYRDVKEDFEKNSVDNLLSTFKRSSEDSNFKPSYNRNIHSSVQRKRSPYGLVYNQGKPIGILEPISQSFEYSTYNNPRDNAYHSSLYKSQWYPSKRDVEVDEERDESDLQSSGLHSSNYANVLAKFKVNNKVKHRPYQDFLYSQQVKREAAPEQAKEKEAEDLKKRGAIDMGELSRPSNVAKAKRNEATAKSNVDNAGKENLEKIVEIEENLKDVMSDMGLVEKDKEANAEQNDAATTELKKREIYFEDEDLENGLNKIGLTKESHYDRNKKENCPGKTKGFKASKSTKRAKSEKKARRKLKKKPEEEEEGSEEDDSKRSISQNHMEKKATHNGETKAQIANYQSEGEAYIRSKRQEKENEKTEDSDIMKGLEQSGDLTVSGNKSPLVAVTSADDPEFKKSQEKRDKEELEYEKRLERNIQAKIDAIKEEVKREITKLQYDDEKLKDIQRKKREIANTLLDEETSAIDPSINIDQKLEPYVRKRRDLDPDLHLETSNEKENYKTKRNAPSEELTIDKSQEESNNDANMQESNKNVREANTDSGNREERSIIDDIGIGFKKGVKDNKMEKESRDAINEISDASADADKSLSKRNGQALESSMNSESDPASEANKEKDVMKRNDDIFADDISAVANHEINNKLDTSANENAEQMVAKRSDKLPIDKTVLELDANAPRDVVKRSAELGESKKIKEEPVAASSENKVKRNEMEIDLSTGKTIIDLDEFKDKTLTKDVSAISDEGIVKSLNERDDQSSIQESNLERTNDKEVREGRSVNISNKAESIKQKGDNKIRHERDSKENKQETEDKKRNNDVAENADRLKRGVQKNNSENIVEDGESLLNSDQNSAEEVLNDSLELRSVESQRCDDRLDNSQNIFGQKRNKNHLLGKNYENNLYSTVDVDREAKMPVPLSNSHSSDLNFDRVERNTKNTMNVLDEDSNVYRQNRKRRESNYRDRRYFRRKRDDFSENPDFISYRAENDGEVDEEGDEMDDDGFNDQTSNFVNKRQIEYEQENDNFRSNEDDEDYPMYMERNKRNTLQRIYADDDDDDADESYGNFLFYPNRVTRRKRQNFDQMVAANGGGPTLNHLAAVRERNMRPVERNYRRKRLEKMNKLHGQKQTIAELSDADIFGGLPQSYEGELSRFKRVKRSAKVPQT